MRNGILSLCFLALFGMVLRPAVAGEPGGDWPNRTVSIYMATSAGGGTDVQARYFANLLSKKFGQPFIVVNQAGSGGQIAANSVTSAKPDGYSLLGWHISSLIGNITGTFPEVAYEILDPICTPMTDAVMSVNVRADSDIKDIQDLVRRMREEPGSVKWGGNTGAYPYLMVMSFQEAMGGEITWVHTGDTSENTAALQGGQVDVIYDSYRVAQQYVKSGEWRALCSMAPERDAMFPQLPTARENGIDFVYPSLFYLYYGTKGTPRIVYDRLNAAFQEFLADEKIAKELTEMGFVIDYKDQAETTRFVKEFHESILPLKDLF